MEQVYHSRDLYGWLDPLLTDAEFEVGEVVEAQARNVAPAIPTGDHWA